MNQACIEWLARRGINYHPVKCTVFQQWLRVRHLNP